MVDEGKLLGLLNPIVGMIFALTFVVVWSRQKNKLYILLFGLSFVGMAVGYVLSHFIISRVSMLSILVVMPIYALSCIAIIAGLCQRSGMRWRIAPLLTIGAGGIVVAVICASQFEFLNWRIYATNATLGLIFAIGTYRLRHTAKLGGFDRAVVVMMAMIAAQFLIAPAITLMISGPVDQESYRHTTHWIVVNFLTAVSSVCLSLGLIGMCASDLLKTIMDLANTDTLSGLRTRRAFEESVEQAMSQQARTSVPICLMMLDIDHFKRVNDEFGHPAGDAVIQKLGKLLKSNTRNSDVAGRLGGEEFGVFAWNCSLDDARRLGEAIATIMSRSTFKELSPTTTVTISIGVAQAFDGEDYASFYKRADAALYAAKEKGRNRVEVESVDHASGNRGDTMALLAPGLEDLLNSNRKEAAS
ncbi:MAG: GGDEF domain-containing protein [Pseudomonadota bacterium]